MGFADAVRFECYRVLQLLDQYENDPQEILTVLRQAANKAEQALAADVEAQLIAAFNDLQEIRLPAKPV